MRTAVFLFFVLLGFESASGSCDQASSWLRVASLNLMNKGIQEKDADPSWESRRAAIVQWVRDENPDVLGTQEGVQEMIESLAKDLKTHRWVGRGRGPTPDSDEFAAVFFRQDKLKAVRDGSFWLSETPRMAGWKGWDAAHPRIATWVELEDKKTRKTFFVFNVHLDNEGKKARLEGSKLLARKTSEIAGDAPVLLTGDFNAPEESGLLKPLEKFKLARSLSRTPPQGPAETFPGSMGRIDHIFVPPGTPVCRYETKALKTKEGKAASDHHGIRADVIIVKE